MALSENEKEYLKKHPNIKSLQPHLGRNALYLTRYGAVTLEQAMELDALCLTLPRKTNKVSPIYDNYSANEDTFIDKNGMSSGLH